ncbi:serine/threonine-protein kinase 31-like isoform X1 [Lingula anatina]|uniref:Serine/threonine-protein kinase 31-like isoform X1 n=1 Tax=Lingula anatina TaxID=7574 RepID=A0A1S3JA70_LINAN|nr:serine/threonine-protein kinase 31-like isoform X1 [Lingula anatina]|eukprot:XP_013407218.1 serine/threonine-protein kinase 31-like isoform X1 [Lingula anatina]
MVAVKDSATVFKTTFSGRDAVLREYIVGSHGGGSQEEFLKKAKDYKALGSGRLVPLEAIFFQKNGCQCFARTPYYKLNAGGLSAKGEASTEAFYKLLYGALEGLCVLHGAGLVHGALHPENVFIGEDGYGVLDFNWSLTPEQRAGTVKTFSNGLKFCPPEMKPGDPPTMQGDLYCFGLLILWLHFPEVNMSAVDSDGVQYIPAYGVTPTLKLVLEAVLQRNPAQRATAERLLQSDFFTETPLVNSEEFEPETLQLRPRGLSPSPTSQGKGILKNGTAKLQRPEVVETKMWKSDIDVTAIPLPIESDSQESFTEQMDTEQISFKCVDIKTEENRAADGGDVTPTGDLDIFPTKIAHRN